METLTKPTAMIVATYDPITHPIKSHDEYRKLLDELKALSALDPELDTPEGDRLQVLILFIGDYEERNYKFPDSWEGDAVDYIEYRMDQMDWKPKDLVPYIGSRAKVSEILNRKRPLSLRMMRRLHSGLDMSLSELIRPMRQET